MGLAHENMLICCINKLHNANHKCRFLIMAINTHERNLLFALWSGSVAASDQRYLLSGASRHDRRKEMEFQKGAAGFWNASREGQQPGRQSPRVARGREGAREGGGSSLGPNASSTPSYTKGSKPRISPQLSCPACVWKVKQALLSFPFCLSPSNSIRSACAQHVPQAHKSLGNNIKCELAAQGWRINPRSVPQETLSEKDRAMVQADAMCTTEYLSIPSNLILRFFTTLDSPRSALGKVERHRMLHNRGQKKHRNNYFG